MEDRPASLPSCVKTPAGLRKSLEIESAMLVSWSFPTTCHVGGYGGLENPPGGRTGRDSMEVQRLVGGQS